jgi:hypothetical protein
METITKEDWQSCNSQVFWGELAPSDHLIQIYESDEIFLDMLQEFVSGGFETNECVIIVATSAHMQALEDRLISKGFDTNALRTDGQYISLTAQETLDKFMVNSWPDEELFNKTVSELIKSGHHKKRRVRVFGEMVALLWAQGFKGATIQLEHLWNRFCDAEAFCLFCAYPKSGFTQDVNSSVHSICCAHTKTIGGLDKSTKEIFYKNTEALNRQ